MSLPPPAADRTCLITGASSGIGAELARNLARLGHGLTLVARREDRLKALAEELAPHGGRMECVTADLSDPGDRKAVFDAVAAAGLAVDLLCNNAGFGTAGPVRLADRERELAQVRTNVEAVVDLCTLFVPGMVERGRGAVLNTASTASFQPLPGQAGYASSKAFVLSYTQSLNAELRGTGVTATALCPGPVRTEFLEAAGISDSEAQVMPRFMWVSAEKVASAAVEGVRSGNGVVIPGLPNRAAALGAHLTPRRVLLPILSRFHPALRGA